MITDNDVLTSLKNVGIAETDSILVHSSLKSFGIVDGGAETVIFALKRAVDKGTLIMPAFCQKNFAYAYSNWNIKNSPSDVGIITEVFRQMSGVVRSNQATHSVCAFGKDAAYFIKNHGKGKKRIGIYGDTPFAHSSPWDKMYKSDTKVVLLGVDFSVNTFGHYVEYKIVNDILDSIKDRQIKHDAAEQILTFDDMLPFRLKTGDIPSGKVWLNIKRIKAQTIMTDRKLLNIAYCGSCKIISFKVRDYVDFQYSEVIKEPEKWLSVGESLWVRKYIN